jgi:hypothetical protein
MTFKILICAAALALLPAMSFAYCAGKDHQAQSCAPGSTWDPASESCVEQISS